MSATSFASPSALQVDPPYAGFWSRLAAGTVDLLILLPVSVFVMWISAASKTVAIVALLISTPLFWGYNLYFHANYGQTPGKMLLKVVVLRTDGRPIGWRESWMRSSVDLLFALATLLGSLLALQQISAPEYAALSWTTQAAHLATLTPGWVRTAQTASIVWVYSEFIVLLLNRRRRAIHDFIAGTVVVKLA